MMLPIPPFMSFSPTLLCLDGEPAHSRHFAGRTVSPVAALNVRDVARCSSETDVPPYAKRIRSTMTGPGRVMFLFVLAWISGCGATESTAAPTAAAERPAAYHVPGFPHLPLSLVDAPDLRRFVSRLREMEALPASTNEYPKWVEDALSPFLTRRTTLRSLGFRAIRRSRGRPLDEQAASAGLLGHLLRSTASSLDAVEPPEEFATHRDELRSTSAALRAEARELFTRCARLADRAGTHMHVIARFCADASSG